MAKKTTKKDTKILGDNPSLDALIPNRDVHSTWETPESFARHINTIEKENGWCGAGWKKGNEEFSGTMNMQEALDLAATGWPEGRDKVGKVLDLVNASNPVAPKIKKYGIAGSSPNVPRAIAGNPINMRTQEPALNRRRPTITIVADMAAHADIDKDAITNRASVIAAVVDRIETAGYSCEVLAVALSEGGSFFDDGESGFTVSTSVLVKTAGQTVDVGRLAFGLGHVAMFRRLIFADWGGHSEFKKLGQGLGHGNGLVEEDHAHFKEKNIYILTGASGSAKHFVDEKTCAKEGLQYIIDELKKQGCPAFAG